MSRSLGARSLTTSPPIFRSPSVMSSRPAIIRSAVDFPQPDGPTRMTNSPSPISRFMCLTASKPSGYRLTTSSNSISAMCSASPPDPFVRRFLPASILREPVLVIGPAGRGPGHLALDRTRGEPGDDAPLEEEDHDD